MTLPFPDQCRAAGLPVPVAEHRFARPRRWRFDWAWHDHGLAIEVEGGVWTRGRHVRPKGFLGDCVKYNEAAILGWRVLRFTPEQMADGTALAAVERILKGGG